MESRKPAVFVVDDDESVRAGLQELMASVSLDVVAFSSAQEFLEAYEPDWHGCLLLDVRMPGASGLRLQEELQGRRNPLPIIFITGHGDVPMAVEAIKKGAFDFLEKPVRGQILIEKVQFALERDRQLQQTQAKIAEVKAKLTLLTEKEREVLTRVKKGERSKLIALASGVSRKTIDAHLNSIREKLGVDSTAQLVMLLHETGMPDLRPSLA